MGSKRLAEQGTHDRAHIHDTYSSSMICRLIHFLSKYSHLRKDIHTHQEWIAARVSIGPLIYGKGIFALL